MVLEPDLNSSLFTFHSYRVMLATQLGACGESGPTIQAMCRWQSEASLKIYNRLQPIRALQMLCDAQNVDIESYTAANLPCISSYTLAQASWK